MTLPLKLENTTDGEKDVDVNSLSIVNYQMLPCLTEILRQLEIAISYNDRRRINYFLGLLHSSKYPLVSYSAPITLIDMLLLPQKQRSIAERYHELCKESQVDQTVRRELGLLRGRETTQKKEKGKKVCRRRRRIK